MSSLRAASACSRLVVERSPDCRAKTMSTASRNRKIPPAMRKASTPMVSVRRSSSPTKKKTTRMIKARDVPLSATRRVLSTPAWRVNAAKVADTPIGSTTTKKVTKAVTMFSMPV